MDAFLPISRGVVLAGLPVFTVPVRGDQTWIAAPKPVRQPIR